MGGHPEYDRSDRLPMFVGIGLACIIGTCTIGGLIMGWLVLTAP